MSALNDRLTSSLSSRASRSILRQLTPSNSSSATPLIDFSSNDYLSLSRSRTLHQAFLDSFALPPSDTSESTSSALTSTGESGPVATSAQPEPPTAPPLSPYGPPSSRLLDGNSPSHLALESQLADFLGAPAALLFNSGFDANVALWTVLPAPEDYVLFDALIHASAHDGMRGSRVPRERRRAFAHNDLRDLEAQIRAIVQGDGEVARGRKSVWIGVETLYSMDGDLAPLGEVVKLVERLLPAGNGHFVVDEVSPRPSLSQFALGRSCLSRAAVLTCPPRGQAHSTGIYGRQGRGIVSLLGLEDRITVRVHTFGKAMACSGGQSATLFYSAGALTISRRSPLTSINGSTFLLASCLVRFLPYLLACPSRRSQPSCSPRP